MKVGMGRKWNGHKRAQRAQIGKLLLCAAISPIRPLLRRFFTAKHEVLKKSCSLLFFVRFVVFVVKIGLRLAALCPLFFCGKSIRRLSVTPRR
jgi:hypothetical protein